MSCYGLEVNGKWIPFDMGGLAVEWDLDDIQLVSKVPFDPRQLEPCIQIPCPSFVDHRFEDGDD